MHVSADASPITQTAGCPWPGETRLSTKNPDHYRPVNLDGIIEVALACGYEPEYMQVVERFRLIADTGTGTALLRDIAALSRHGVQLAIGPRDDGADRTTHRYFDGVATTVDGQPSWDCLGVHYVSGHRFDTSFYSQLISELAQVRNLAMQLVWPDIPPLREQDVRKAFLAEIGTRAVPALAEPKLWPIRPESRTELDPLCPPEWRDPVSFDTLEGLAPAWISRDFRPHRSEALEILQTIRSVPMGEYLLNELGVYARSNAIMLVHRSGRGMHGVHDGDDRTPIWCFDRAALEQRGQEGIYAVTGVMTVREARACGAFLELQTICEKLLSKLGLLSYTQHTDAMAEQFKRELLEKPASSGLLCIVVEPDGKGPALPVSTTVPPALGVTPSTTESAELPRTAPATTTSKRNRVAQWIASTARALGSAGSGSAASPMIAPPLEDGANEYAPDPLRNRRV
jgi:hypothetical protein